MKQLFAVVIGVLLSSAVCFAGDTKSAPTPSSVLPSSGDAKEPVVGEGNIISNVNLGEAKLERQDGRKLRISFKLDNQDKKAWSQGVRYGADLIRTSKEGDQTLVDSFTAAESLNIAPQQSQQLAFDYTVPSSLAGSFTIVVKAYNEGGVTLGLGHIQNVMFAGEADVIIVQTEECVLRISGDSKKYSLSQGVDFTQEETLTLSCPVINRSNNTAFLTPTFETFFRNRFGKTVKTESPLATNSRIFLPNEEKTLDIVIPHAMKPQAYDVKVTLHEESESKMVSNSVFAHYVLNGTSATIQEVSFNKDSYQEGETLKATLFTSASADGFIGARGGSGPLAQDADAVVALRVTDRESGQNCITPLTQTIALSLQSTVLTAPVIRKCMAPQASVTLSNEEGALFDTRDIALAKPMMMSVAGIPVSPLTMKRVALAFGGIFLLIGLITIAWKQRQKMSTRSLVKSLFFATLVTAGILGSSGEAKAIVFYDIPVAQLTEAERNNYIAQVDYYENGNLLAAKGTSFVDLSARYMTWTASTNKLTYTQGETMTVSATGQNTDCGNSHPMHVSAQIYRNDQVTAYGSEVAVYTQTGNITNGSTTMNAPNVDGTYKVKIIGRVYPFSVEPGKFFYGIGWITITVSGAPPANGGGGGGGNPQPQPQPEPQQPQCPAQLSRHDVTGALAGGTVWGDNTFGYTDDSNWGTAAVHAGLLNVGSKGTIFREVLGMKSGFPGGTQNGVTSTPYAPSWCAVKISLACPAGSWMVEGICPANTTELTHYAPTIDNKNVVANGTTQYTIESRTGLSGAELSVISDDVVVINEEGPNAGNYRGLLGWNRGAPAVGLFTSSNWFLSNRPNKNTVTCTGNAGGTAAINTDMGGVGPRYGSQYLNLMSCIAMHQVDGDSKALVVWYTVKFDPAFVNPIANNTLSAASMSQSNKFLVSNGGKWKTGDKFSLGVASSDTLKICLNSCNSKSSDIEFAPGDEKKYVVCYNNAPPGDACSVSLGDITALGTTSFAANNNPNDAVTPLSEKGKFRGNNVAAVATENVLVNTANGSITFTPRVTPAATCTSNCSAEAPKKCSGKSFTTKNSCAVDETCVGTRACNFNMKEVAP